MSASIRAIEAQPTLFKPLDVRELEKFPEVGDCQICRRVVDLKKGEHACGR